MDAHDNEWDGLTPEEKRIQLFRNQKALLDQFLQKHAITPAQYALDYLTKNPIPACAIAAFSSVAQLEDSIVG